MMAEKRGHFDAVGFAKGDVKKYETLLRELMKKAYGEASE